MLRPRRQGSIFIRHGSRRTDLVQANFVRRRCRCITIWAWTLERIRFRRFLFSFKITREACVAVRIKSNFPRIVRNVPAVWSAPVAVCGCLQSGRHAVAAILDDFSGETNMSMKKILVSALFAAGMIGAMATPLSSVAADVFVNVGPPALRIEAVPEQRAGYVWAP